MVSVPVNVSATLGKLIILLELQFLCIQMGNSDFPQRIGGKIK